MMALHQMQDPPPINEKDGIYILKQIGKQMIMDILQ